MAFTAKRNIKRVKPSKLFLAKYLFKVSKKKGSAKLFFNACALIFGKAVTKPFFVQKHISQVLKPELSFNWVFITFFEEQVL